MSLSGELFQTRTRLHIHSNHQKDRTVVFYWTIGELQFYFWGFTICIDCFFCSFSFSSNYSIEIHYGSSRASSGSTWIHTNLYLDSIPNNVTIDNLFYIPIIPSCDKPKRNTCLSISILEPHATITRWCPEIAKLLCNWVNSMAYARYIELVFMGFKNQHSHHWAGTTL